MMPSERFLHGSEEELILDDTEEARLTKFRIGLDVGLGGGLRNAFILAFLEMASSSCILSDLTRFSKPASESVNRTSGGNNDRAALVIQTF
jgi:hypothetical protein